MALTQEIKGVRIGSPRQPKLDAPGMLHLVMGRGIYRAEIFREQEEDFQGTAVVLTAGDEEDGLFRSGSGPFPWRDHLLQSTR